MQCLCNRLIIASCVLHHNPGFTVKRFQLPSKRGQSFRGVGNIEWKPNDLAEGAKYGNRTLSTGNINAYRVYNITPDKNL